MKTLTPFGVRDYLPSEVEQHESVLDVFRAVFRGRGYRRIITPSIEYFDSIKDALGESLRKRCVRFYDSSGSHMVLRPDHTAPIARIAAQRLLDESAGSQKLFYLDPVFRVDPFQGEMEIFQAGVETIGEGGVKQDADVLLTAIESLEKMGFSDVVIDLGHQDFAKEWTEQEVKQLRAGDYVSIGRVPAQGGVELVADYPELKALYAELDKAGKATHIRFNKGLIKESSYYTGIVFDCYISGFGKKVGSGGRYDGLLSHFGKNAAAVGFAMQVNRLLRAKEREDG